jgi:hypothetical protein
MPKSKIRKKVKEHQVVEAALEREPVEMESPSWLAPTMVAAFLIGLVWIVIFYVTTTSYPIPGIGAWNMVVGFGFIGVGFALATRWR